MSHRIFRGSWLRLLLAFSTFVFLHDVLHPQQPRETPPESALESKEEGKGENIKEIEADGEDIQARLRWFDEQRQYPNHSIDRDYLFKAWMQVAQRRAEKGGSTFSLTQPIEKENKLQPSSFTFPGTAESQGAFTWSNLGPMNAAYSGRVAVGGIAVDPSNVNIVYVAGADGGVWKTTNGGTSWSPLTDRLPTLTAGAIAVDPGNSNKIYFGTGDPAGGSSSAGVGLFKSTDGGGTWVLTVTASQVGNRISRIAVDPSNGQKVFLASEMGLFRSLDAGSTWTRLLTTVIDINGWSVTKVWSIVIDPTNSNIVLSALSGARTPGDSSAGIYKSSDGGTTWNKITAGLPTDSRTMGRTEIAMAKSNSNILIAGIADNATNSLLGLYKSTNKGDTWSKTPLSNDVYGPGGGWYDNFVTINPTDPNIMFIGGKGIWRSTDGGGTWSYAGGVIGGSFHGDEQAVAWAGSTLYVGDDGGIFKSANNGGSYQSANTNLVITQFYPGVSLDKVTPSNIWGGSQDNGPFKRTAVSWPTMPGTIISDATVTGVDYTNSSIAYFTSVHQSTRIRRTTDGGSTWTAVVSGIGSESFNWVEPFAIDPIAPTTLYTASSRFYKSTNRGDTWVALSTLPNADAAQWLAVHPTNPNIIYISAMYKLYKSIDGGVSWNQIWTSQSFRYITRVAFDPTNPGILYATLSGTGVNHVWKSLDAGGTWTSISGDLPDLPVNAIKPDTRNSSSLYIGTDLGFFYTTNGGVNWSHDDAFPNAIVNDIGITSDSNLIAATYGRGMFSSHLPSLVLPTSSITVGSPNGGENWVAGSIHDITWTETGITNVKIEYSTVNGTNWSTIVASTSASAGSYAWTVPNSPTSQALVRVSDASNASMFDLSNAVFVISQPPGVTVTSPIGGENWVANSTQNITWTETGITDLKIEYSTNNGTGWNTIVASTAAGSGSYAWTVTNTPTNQGLVRIIDASSPMTGDTSSHVFTIAAPPSLTVISPNGGESWNVLSSHTITWSSVSVSNVKIEFTIDNGNIWSQVIASTPASSGSFSWTVPNTPTAQALIRISDATNALLKDSSNAPFSIVAMPAITVTSPNGGETWSGASTQAITWISASVTKLRIEYSTNNGSSWALVVDSLNSAGGNYSWIVPNSQTSQALVRISDVSNLSLSDLSNNAFTIVASGPPSVKVLSANGGEVWVAGSVQTVRWSSVGISAVKLSYSTNGGSNWRQIITNVPAPSGLFAWNVPNKPTTKCLLRITGASVTDQSDGLFTIGVLQPMATGWNLSASPVETSDEDVGTLYPGAISPIFTFINGGYVTRNKPVPGQGFWIKYDQSISETMRGDALQAETLSVEKGWNLIGGISFPIAVANIITDPSGIIASRYFTYEDTYVLKDTVSPGRGYWVKAELPGKLVLMDTTFDLLPRTVSDSDESRFSRLELQDATGITQTLYFTDENTQSTYETVELPPVPPVGLFDARFRSNRMLEVLRHGKTEEHPVVLASVHYPLHIHWAPHDPLQVHIFLLVDKKRILIEREDSIIVQSSISRLGLTSVDLTDPSPLPVEVALLQNYPNPFNPITLIRYSLSQGAWVSLRVYDISGKEVASLVNERKDSGEHRLSWDASSLPSGVYFYRLQAGRLTQTKKMVLTR